MNAARSAHQHNSPRLGDILGQDRAIATLRAALGSRRVHHAWIFSGPKGVGKFTTALAFAAALLGPASRAESDRPIHGEDQSDTEASGLLDLDAHPDLHVIRKELARFSDDPAVRNRVLSSIPKQVIDQFLLQPLSRAATRTDGGIAGKVFIIDEAELLDRSIRHAPTQASLLKALEEPPPGTVLILVTSNEGRLLPTIRSRCQRVPFGLLDDRTMQQWIEHARIRQKIIAMVGEEFRADVLAIRRNIDEEYEEDRKSRKRTGRGTMSAPKRKYYEFLADLLVRYRDRSFTEALPELPEQARKELDPSLMRRIEQGPPEEEIDWLRRFSAGSPGRFMDAALTRLYEWHTALDPLFRGKAGGYEIGQAMRTLIDEWAKAHVKRGSGEKRSKEAANLEAIRHMIVLLGERSDDGLRRLVARGVAGDDLRDSGTMHRMLGMIDAIQTSERRLASNVNLEQGLVSLGAALRA